MFHIIAKTHEELQVMVNSRVVSGRLYDIEIIIEESQVMRVARRN